MPSRDANPWELAQQNLRQILDEHSYKNWFSQTRYESCEQGKLVISVPSQFFADWLHDHYLDAISDSVRDVIPDFGDVQFVAKPEVYGLRDEALPIAVPPVSKRKAAKAVHAFNGFNARYTFNRFVVGAGNRFAHAAAKAVSESPARAYNPLFLYGGTGLGKTHLMQSIGRETLERDPGRRVVFLSSEDFTNQLIESIAKKATKRFRAKYRKADVLLIDDIHFIAGKEATQEEFFHTFNALFDMHSQIVVSSDRGPKEIQGLESRLVSRFEWGLITDIQAPDLETRVAILQNKAAEENHTMPLEVIRYIATHITTNIRELEGALITVLAFSRLTKQQTTLPMAEEVLRDLIGGRHITPITIEAIKRAVAEHFDVRIADLCSRNRQRSVSFPRQIAMHLCKKLVPSLSFNEIGEAFGGKDHTTVLYACQKISRETGKVTATRQTIERIEKTLRS